jgi:4-amino-4-deoxy-L-arabinose transferase-like glycosyltransferase
MEEKINQFLQKLNEWLLKAGDWLVRRSLRLLTLMHKFSLWYQSINWPEIPLTLLQWILLFYVLFGFLYMWATPIFEASDELWHFGMVEYIREEGALPVFDISDPETLYESNRDTSYRQEGSQPPLYYALMAAITSPIDISDAEQYRIENPHVRAGEPGSFGNKNLVLHPVGGAPLQGTPLAVYLIRTLGITLGAVTIWAVYQSGVLISPHRPIVGYIAAALTALNPMFIFISASVNNDTLVIMLDSLVIWLALLMMKEGFEWKRSLAIAGLLAAATLTKLSALVLIPVIALGALWLAYRSKNWKGLLLLGGSMLIAWLLIAGWWYLRNLDLYGELLGTQTMAAVAGLREEPMTVGRFLGEFEGFRNSYWGVFGAFNVITTPIYYALMDFIVFVAMFGVIFLVAQLLAIQDFSFARREISLVLFLIGILLLGLIAFLNWTSITLASQGRLLFPYLAAMSPLLAAGLAEVIWWLVFLLSPPDRSYVRAGDAVPEPILREALRWPIRFIGALVFMIPITTIMPHYSPPPPIIQAQIPAEAQTVFARFDNIELIAYNRIDRRYAPGEFVRLTFYWRVIEPTENDMSLALALISPSGDPISKETLNTYPGGGTLRTSTWEVGAIYADTYEIQLANNINARYPFRVEVNWYETEPENRLTPLNRDDNEISVLLDVGAVVQPRLLVSFSGLAEMKDVEQQQRFFGNQILLTHYGYNLYPDDQTFTLDVMWETGTQVDGDYATFMHVYDSDGNLITQYDFRPELPTPYWGYGEDYRLVYFVNPPEEGFVAGDYTVHVGWYDYYAENQPRLLISEATETEPEQSTYELFTFTAEADGTLVLPVLELPEEATEEPLSGAPIAPSQSPLPDITEEATIETTVEPLVTDAPEEIPEATGEAGSETD